MEWEQEQLRRGGLRAEENTEKPVKPVYKPAPSRLCPLLDLRYYQLTNVTQYQR